MKIGIASTAERRDHLSFLIARAAEGEDAAFSELYALTNRKMRKTACAVSPRGAEVEDILQDAYLKIWRNAPNFNPDRSSPISWMAVIVRNTAIDALRLKTLPTTDLDFALLVPEPVPDGADDSTTTAPGRSPRPRSASSRTTARRCCRSLISTAKAGNRCRSVSAYPSAPSRPGCGERWRRCAPIARRSRLRRRIDRVRTAPN